MSPSETKRQIPLSFPTLGDREAEYVLDCLRTKWISSVGSYVSRFEAAFAAVTGAKHAITCSNGTAALHLALLGLGVKPGDEVLVPTLTFAACANAVTSTVEPSQSSWTSSQTPGVSTRTQLEALITSKTRGVIAVHLRGHPAEWMPSLAIARRHGLFVLEDAAQAHGARVRGVPVGALGDVATFSFFGNKMLTTGEGGMVTTNDDGVAERIRLLKNQGMTQERRYWHPVIGYNYRLTNVQAAIGLAQVERLESQLSAHRQVASWYREELDGVPGLAWQAEREWAEHAWWQFVAVVDESFAPDRDEVLKRLQADGIDARRIYYPMHQLPIYQGQSGSRTFPVADRLADRAVCLPTWAGLTRDDVRFVCDRLKDCAR